MKPHLVFYLDVDPNELVHRVFQKNSSLDYSPLELTHIGN